MSAPAAQPSTSSAAIQAPKRMPTRACSSTSATPAMAATSQVCPTLSDSAASPSSSTRIPRVKPATPPGEGDSGSEIHCDHTTIGTSISATASPAQPAARSDARRTPHSPKLQPA